MPSVASFLIRKGLGQIPYYSSAGGSVEIEPERWQLISIPVQYGYWDSATHAHIDDGTTPATIKRYIIDQIEDTFAVDASTMVEVINTYIGDIHKMYNYVCGITIDVSEHNFELSYNDNGKTEYCGLWIKSIHSTPFDLKWGVQ